MNLYMLPLALALYAALFILSLSANNSQDVAASLSLDSTLLKGTPAVFRDLLIPTRGTTLLKELQRNDFLGKTRILFAEETKTVSLLSYYFLIESNLSGTVSAQFLVISRKAINTISDLFLLYPDKNNIAYYQAPKPPGATMEKINLSVLYRDTRFEMTDGIGKALGDTLAEGAHLNWYWTCYNALTGQPIRNEYCCTSYIGENLSVTNYRDPRLTGME